jgi:hypothetical protein
VFCIEAALDPALLGVKFVQYGVCIAPLMVREDRYLAQLGQFDQELSQMGPLVDEYFTAKFFVLNTN